MNMMEAMNNAQPSKTSLAPYVFTGERAIEGRHLNRFCMSLMSAANRTRFKADERAYLDEWQMTRIAEAGGPEARFQVAARTGRQYLLRAQDRGCRWPADSVRGRLVCRSIDRRVRCDDAQRRTQPDGTQVDFGTFLMARITAGIGSSHVPAIGAALDGGRTAHPDWAPIFAGYEWSRKLVAEQKPDVVILVYNDHASAFSLDIVPTFALGCADSFAARRRRLGPAPRPASCTDHSKLAWHIATSVVLDEFDLTIMNEMHVDHGLTVPMSLMLGQPAEWPVKVIPLAVNVIQYPTPTANRCFRLGEAIARAVKSFPEDLNVQIWGTGGMSHQLSGERAGLINREWDTQFLDQLSADPGCPAHPVA